MKALKYFSTTPVLLMTILVIAQELDINFCKIKISHMAYNLLKLRKFRPVKI